MSRELRAEQEDLRRVVAPEQEHEKRARDSIDGRKSALTQIITNREFTNAEKYGGHRAADPYIRPCQFFLGHVLEQQCENDGRDTQGQKYINHNERRSRLSQET